MKRKGMAMLLTAVLLMGLLPGCSKTVTVETDLKHMELEGLEKGKTGSDYAAELIADDGYMLPDDITVKVDGKKLSEKKYEYDPEDGQLFISGEYITGDVRISGKAEEITLLGLWYADIDLAPIAYNWLYGTIAVRYMQNFQFSKIPLGINLVFLSDGSYSVFTDENLSEKLEAEFMPQLEESVIRFYEQVLAEKGGQMSVAEALEAQEVTTDDLVQEFLGAGDLGDFRDYLENILGMGTFTEDGHRIFFNNRDEGIPYELKGGKLILEHGGSGFHFEEMLFPVKFEYRS